jgi:hypothetical protein
MNKNQTRILNMSNAVIGALNKLPEIATLPALALKIEDLKARLDVITATAALQILPTTGQTVNRDQVLDIAITATLAVAGRVQSYAHSRKLPVLESKVRLRPTSFTATPLANRIPLMQQVCDAAGDVLAELADFGVTEASLTDLQTKIDAANAVKTSLRAAVVDRRVATAKLVEQFRELGEFLRNDLDPLVESLRQGNPEGWATYRVARDVLNQPRPTPAEPEPEGATAATTVPSSVPADKLAA